MLSSQPGQLRVGMVLAYKGLEANGVILVGIDSNVDTLPQTLYVDVSSAGAAQYVLALTGVWPIVLGS